MSIKKENTLEISFVKAADKSGNFLKRNYEKDGKTDETGMKYVKTSSLTVGAKTLHS